MEEQRSEAALTTSTVRAVTGWIEQSWDRLQDLIPSHVNRDRFKRIIIDQVKFNPEVAKCTPESVFRACVQAANLGLEVGVLNSAYLVRYKNTCQLIPGYAGLIDLARRSGAVKSVNVYLVKEKDEIYMNGDGEIEAKIDPFGDRGERIGAVCVLTMANGSRQYTTMSNAEYEKTRPSHWTKTPHRTHPDEMHKKACIRRALKTVPLTPEAADLIRDADIEFIDREAEPAEVDAEVEVQEEAQESPVETEEATSATERLAAQIAGAEETIPEPPPVVQDRIVPVTQEERELAEEDEDPALVEARKRAYRIPWSRVMDKLREVMRQIDGVPEWERMTMQRKVLIGKRMKQEGFEPEQWEEFCDFVAETMLPFDSEKISGWSSRTFEALIRVPGSRGVDHFQLAKEGQYKAREEVQDVEPVWDPLAD